jgi:hypothetical protein
MLEKRKLMTIKRQLSAALILALLGISNLAVADIHESNFMGDSDLNTPVGTTGASSTGNAGSSTGGSATPATLPQGLPPHADTLPQGLPPDAL